MGGCGRRTTKDQAPVYTLAFNPDSCSRASLALPTVSTISPPPPVHREVTPRKRELLFIHSVMDINCYIIFKIWN